MAMREEHLYQALLAIVLTPFAKVNSVTSSLKWKLSPLEYTADLGILGGIGGEGVGKDGSGSTDSA